VLHSKAFPKNSGSFIAPRVMSATDPDNHLFRGGDPDFQNFGGTPDAVQRNRELGAYPASKQYFVNLQVRF